MAFCARSVLSVLEIVKHILLYRYGGLVLNRRHETTVIQPPLLQAVRTECLIELVTLLILQVGCVPNLSIRLVAENHCVLRHAR
jgi:hypothetical protein